jgi:hypothetical protein
VVDGASRPTRPRRALGGLWLALVCSSALGGFGAPSPAGPSDTGGAPVVFSGRAIAKSDVTGLPDTPLRQGEILVFPAASAEGLRRAADLGPGPLHYARFDLDERTVTTLGGTVVRLDADGRFAVALRPGPYVLCLSGVFPDHRPGPPFAVVGCDGLEFRPGTVVLVAFGEGGVEAAAV